MFHLTDRLSTYFLPLKKGVHFPGPGYLKLARQLLLWLGVSFHLQTSLPTITVFSSSIRRLRPQHIPKLRYMFSDLEYRSSRGSACGKLYSGAYRKQPSKTEMRSENHSCNQARADRLKIYLINPFTRVMMDGQDRFWLLTDETEKGKIWVIVSFGGKPLGRLLLPANSVLYTVKDGKLYLVNNAGEPAIEVYPLIL